MKRVISLLLALMLLAGIPAGSAADTYDDRAGGILAYLESTYGAGDPQELADGFLADTAGSVGDWYVITLVQAGYRLDFSAYSASLDKYVAQNAGLSATTRQRIALVYTALGISNYFVYDTLNTTIGTQGVMSLIYGLHLLNNGLTSENHTLTDTVTELIALQGEDGGWKVSGTASNVDVTAMALQALAPLYDTDDTVRAAVRTALAYLSSSQLDNGSYKSYGAENSESCAQVLTALTALNIDPESDARFLKNGHSVTDALLSFKIESGGYSHTADGDVNQIATVQAFYALVALNRMRDGYGSLYDFSRHGTVAEATNHSIGYKPIACAVISLLLAITIVFLILSKKRHPANYIFACAVAALLVAFILLTDFQSAGSYYGAATAKTDTTGNVTLQIDCKLLTEHGYESEYIPSDGVLLPATEFSIASDDTVYDILVEACRQYGIQLDHSGSGTFVYVSGIGYLYELQYGSMSGWVYTVNGETANVGCGEYTLRDGDAISWRYTLELGNDLK